MKAATDPTHDPGPAAARERAERAAGAASAPLRPAAGKGGAIRIGTASWTDPTIVSAGVFYPEGASSPEERLRYYASQFSMVEVDSTYYALPAKRMAELWVERTPDEFIFDIKAHALMTGQPSETSRLPQSLRSALPEALRKKARLYGKDLPSEVYGEVWTQFRDAIEPLHAAGKLGSILLQYPRWFLPGAASRDLILDARERLAGLPFAVELRNALWFSERGVDRTLRFLAEERIPFVMVDAPQGLKSSVPPLVHVTSPELAIVRFHGRRAETWEAPRVSSVERYRYLYDKQELEAWVPKIAEAAEVARELHVLMNNCYANYGTTNAVELATLLRKTYGP